jgi:hypothetical protein
MLSVVFYYYYAECNCAHQTSLSLFSNFDSTQTNSKMLKVVKWLKVTKVVNGKNRNTVKMEN